MEKLLSVNGALYTARKDAIAATAAIIENSAYYRRRAGGAIKDYANRHAGAIIGAAIKYGNCRQKDIIVTAK